MKYQTKLLFVLGLSLVASSLSLRVNQDKSKQEYERPEFRSNLRADPAPVVNNNKLDSVTHQHIRASDLLQNYRPMGHHTDGLWEAYENPSYKYAPDYTNGVRGHDWTPPLADPGVVNVFKLASPRPKDMDKPRKRVIADEIPPPTISPSVLDPPKRQNVIQIQLPISSKKEIHYEIDPRLQLPPDVKGTTYHGIDPEKPTVHGVFIQKSEKVSHPEVLGMNKNSPPIAKPKLEKKTEAQEKHDNKMGNITGEALLTARDVELKAKKLQESIEAPMSGPGQLTIKIATTNRRETPDLKLDTHH